MGGASGAGGGGPGSAMSQINGKTLADMPNTIGGTYQQILNQGRDPAEMAASKASWMNAAMGQNGSQAPAQPQAMTIDQQLALVRQGMAKQAGNMPVFNQPVISPQQQYMQRLGITRMPYNQRQFTPQPQPAPKSDNFAWAARVQPSSQQAQSANQPQQSELDKLRSELEEMRSRQAGTYTSGGGGGN